MSNMSYVRFENTLSDLGDCQANMDVVDDDELSKSETNARKKLIECCIDIACEYGHVVGKQVEVVEEVD